MKRLVYQLREGRKIIHSAVIIMAVLSGYHASCQQVSEIHTDYSGYWKTNTTTNNPIFPNNSHNLLAFKVGSTVYSTGVSDATLNTQGVTYTTGSYKALPVSSIGGTGVAGQSLFMALASSYDGVASGFSSPLPSVRIKDVMTDGLNGLNIGTGVTNLPNTCSMTFPVENIDIASLADTKPDFLFTQIADPASASDVIYFVNSSGVTVGNSVTVTWSAITSLGTYYLDLYTLETGVSCDAASITGGSMANTTRNIRMTTFKMSDFGITAANAASVVSLIVKPGGQSDPAFVAYNTQAFTIASPEIVTNPVTQIVCPGTGNSVTFTVTATGSNLTYQWRKNGVNISGATSSSYTINNVTAADAGTYEAVVSNSAGSVSSSIAFLNTAITTQPLPSTQTIATGNTVTLSVTATNATGYQWKKNGVDIAGATSSSLSIPTLITSNGGSFTVNVINSGSSGCANVLSNAAVVVPSTILYSKSTGNLNTAASWGVATDGSGSTPVNFTRSEHTFIISNRTTASTVGNLTIAGTLDVKNTATTIAANTTLDVGALIRSGTGSLVGSSTASLTLRGNSSLYFSTGNEVLKYFTITGGTTTLLSPLTITANNVSGRLSLTGGTLALATNKITLQSTGTIYTAMVTAVGAGASFTYGTGGGFVAERFMPAHRAFRFFSPAVTSTGTIRNNWMEGVNNTNTSTWLDPYPGYGTHITGPGSSTNGFDATNTNNPSLYTYNNSTQAWASVPNTSGTITAGQPYRFMVRGSRSVDLSNNAAAPSNTILRTTGTLVTGAITLNSTLAQNVGAYSFVGNPYASPVSWSSLLKSNLASSYYAWDQSVGVRGAYVSYNSTTSLNSNAASAVNDNIQSEQAFFVQTSAASPSLGFRESDKTVNNTAVFRGTSKPAKMAVALLLNTNGGSNNTTDGLVVLFDDAFADSVGDEDSYKLTNQDENMAISRKGALLSIEARPSISSTDTLPLKLWQFRQNNYYFKIETNDFDPAVTGVLHDAFLGTYTTLDLTGNPTLAPFSITTDSGSFAADRFSLIFKTGTTLSVNVSGVKAFATSEGVQVEWLTKNELNMNAYEIEKSADAQQFEKAGMVQAKNHTLSTVYQWLDKEPLQGDNYYRIKAINKSGETIYSNIVKVKIGNSYAAVTVFPNPVTGDFINLELIKIEKGNYSLNLFSSIGQKVFSNTIIHAGGSDSKAINVNRKLPAGIYRLQISGNGKVYEATAMFE